MRRWIVWALLGAMLCVGASAAAEPVRLFIGQDLEAVGGLAEYAEGYIDTFGKPSGVTTYTSLPLLEGLFSPADWGAGVLSAQAYVDDETFDGVDMAIGLYLVGQTGYTAKGLYKTAIERLGTFIAESGRTVYLRIGYEFDGDWNGYNPEEYIAAFRMIVDTLRDMGVDNVQTVWQSSGNGEAKHLMQWYPGDAYVDWMGYSYFDGLSALVGRGILQLAREHDKPVFIAEATPKRDVKVEDADLLWSAWYEPFLNHVEKNSDVIGAVSYINSDWNSQRMWQGQGWGDSRLQENKDLAARWAEVLESGLFAAD